MTATTKYTDADIANSVPTTRPKHYKYEPGDQVKDLTFDPPLNGVVTDKHDQPDAYYVRIQGAINDVVIHARNLQRN